MRSLEALRTMSFFFFKTLPSLSQWKLNLPLTQFVFSVPLQKADHGQVLLDTVFKHLELTERDYFGLHLTDDSLDTPVSIILKIYRNCELTDGIVMNPNSVRHYLAYAFSLLDCVHPSVSCSWYQL